MLEIQIYNNKTAKEVGLMWARMGDNYSRGHTHRIDLVHYFYNSRIDYLMEIRIVKETKMQYLFQDQKCESSAVNLRLTRRNLSQP